MVKISGVYGWIKNIVCFMCILNLILQLLPGKNYQKYVHFFGGLVLLIIVFSPLADLTEVSANFDKVWRMEGLKEEYSDMELELQGVEELRSKTVNAAYQAEMEKQLEVVAAAYGFGAGQITIHLADGENTSLAVRFIDMELHQESTKEAATAAQIQEIKDEIKEIYHISEQNINIIVQE